MTKIEKAMAEQIFERMGDAKVTGAYAHIEFSEEEQAALRAALSPANIGDECGWHPIATIPRDGKEHFLVRFRSGHIEHVYLTTPEPPLAQTFRYLGGPMQGQQAGWPDHWMRVPAITGGE